MTQLPASAQLVMGIAGVLVALGTIYRWVWPALKAMARGVRGVYRLYVGTQQFVHDWSGGEGPSIPERLGRMERELQTNGGSSMKDDARTSAVEAIKAREVAEKVASDLVTFRAHQAEDTAETRQAVGKVQHDVTNIRAGQEMLLEQQLVTDERVTRHNERNAEHVLELRRAVAEVARDSATRDEALGAALREQLDVTIAVQDASEPTEECP